MSQSEFKQYQRLYRSAKKPEDLPWHREEIPEALGKALSQGVNPKGVLDLGCGVGTFSIAMAKQGHHLTAVDFMPEALRMAEQRAKAVGVNIQFEQADVLTWNSPKRFDLVFDSGCFHSVAPHERPQFKRKLLGWFAPGADYVLIHFGRRHFFDWRPMGPRRRTRADIVQELSPELREREYRESIATAPLPIGPTMLIGEYWFKNQG